MEDSLQSRLEKHSHNSKILFVDDDPNLLRLISANLSDEGYRIYTAPNGQEGVEVFKREKPDLIILDLQMPVMDGLTALGKIKEVNPNQFVIIFSGQDDVNIAFNAISQGAYDYIQKPFEIQRLKVTIANALRNIFLSHEYSQLKSEIKEKYQFDNIIGQSGRMQEIYASVTKILNTNVTVLLLGESGTGKELIARAIHENTPTRNEKPFVAVNCAALPENLLESELFGHEKGAFTGASEKRIGMFEYANGGTLLLDEIGEMPLAMQAKLVRVLQEREFSRVGSNQTIKTNIRVISATNKDLNEMVKEGDFREDLYFRLSVFPIILPPLRERKEDILPLSEFFILKHAKSMGIVNVPSLSKSAYNLLIQYSWPGNVRELENSIERALIESGGEAIMPTHLVHSILVEDKKNLNETAINIEGRTLPQIISEIEQQAIEQSLQKFDFNLSEVAKVLDIGRTTLYRKIEQYGIPLEKQPDS